jgi:hypothetical protein
VPVLVPLVEGQSEERALGVLLRRLIAAGDAPETEIARPFRVPRNKVVREGELERAVAQAVRSRSGATAVLIVLDADDDCAAELAPTLVLSLLRQNGSRPRREPITIDGQVRP